MEHPRAPERIVTARLILRRPAAGDAEEIFARYASDPEVTRLLSWPTHTTVEATRLFIELSDTQWSSRPAGPMLITSRSDGRILGSTGLAFHAAGDVETGYLITRDAWGNGYASEALAGMLDLAAALGVRQVRAHCHTDNAASARVLEKCGFGRRGLARDYVVLPNLGTGSPSDVFCYAADIAPGSRPRIHILRSERLGFGIWGRDDLPLALQLWGNPAVTALIDARGQLRDHQVQERLEHEILLQQEHGMSYWPLFLLSTGEFVGCCGLRPRAPAEKICELGVHLRPEHQGAGLAGEACSEAIRHAFGTLRLRALFAGHHPANEASRRLLGRLGFRHTHDELYPPTGLRHPSYLLEPDAEAQ